MDSLGPGILMWKNQTWTVGQIAAANSRAEISASKNWETGRSTAVHLMAEIIPGAQ